SPNWDGISPTLFIPAYFNWDLANFVYSSQFRLRFRQTFCLSRQTEKGFRQLLALSRQTEAGSR
ncbi:hypothetical protein, partial [Neobacillus vireti]|uniref:hypothetical protein n=1 Tax=Neobacillus vireti TaxID=220686 RepID=UPI001955759C